MAMATNPQASLPFSEQEKRIVVAEAIKTSSIPLEKLLAVLQEGNINVPAWEHMLLPHGRTLNSCKEAFESLRSPPVPAFPSPKLPLPSPSTKRKSNTPVFERLMTDPAPKRRQSGAESLAGARDIRPKPATSNGSPQSMTSLPPTQPKKRGRPTKAEVERKNKQAIAEGKLIPPLLMAAGISHAPGEEMNTGGYTPIAPVPGLVATAPVHVQSPRLPGMREMLDMAGTEDLDSNRMRQRAAPKSQKAITPQQPSESGFSLHPQTRTIGDRLSQQPYTSTPMEGIQASPTLPPLEGPSTVQSPKPGISGLEGPEEAQPRPESSSVAHPLT